MDDHTITTRTVHQFVDEVSDQSHAMAGAVIALSAAQAVALGQACLKISLNLLESRVEAVEHQVGLQIETLAEIKEQLLLWCNRDANAIAEFVALRESGQELAGQQLLCQAPAQVSRLSARAADILKKARRFVNERVQDDLEMSISLLAGTARTAVLLLDSNLRIWPEQELLAQFEPLLVDLEVAIENIRPRKRIRN